MSKLLDGFSGELGKAWWLRLLSPAAAFWLAGALAVYPWRRIEAAAAAFATGTGHETWLVVVVLAFLAVAASGWLIEQVTAPALRLLEGYWPDLLWIRSCGVWAMRRRHDALQRQRQALSAANDTSAAGVLRRIRLDHALRRFPPADRIMPTRLGNILCAAELRPIGKYGLDVVTCWPHLWLTLSKDNRDDLTAARAALDDGVRLWVWSVLALVWGVWSLAAIPLALASAAVGYLLVLQAAATYADLLEAVFDIRRMALYDALGFPKPASPADEVRSGQAITHYLFFGSDDPRPRFTFAPPAKEHVPFGSRKA